MKLREKYELMRALLIELQEKRYHEPNSDYYERCNGCHRSPYNVPPHKEDCFVVKIRDVLKATK